MQDAVSLPCIRSLCIREILHEYSSFAVFTRMCYLKHTYSTIQTFRKTFNRRLAPNEFSKAHLIIEISKLLCNLYFSSNKYYYLLLFFYTSYFRMYWCILKSRKLLVWLRRHTCFTYFWHICHPVNFILKCCLDLFMKVILVRRTRVKCSW